MDTVLRGIKSLIVFGLMGILVLWGLGQIGKFLLLRSTYDAEFRNMSSTEILNKSAKIFGLTFPCNTRLLSSHSMNFQGLFIRIKVEIDKKDLDGFLKSSPFSNGELNERNKRIYCDLEDRIFKPWQEVSLMAKKFKSGEVEIRKKDEVDILRILIDLDKPNNAIIYLEFTN
jgi:hypothetical protein